METKDNRRMGETMTTKQQWLDLAERCEKATGLTWQDSYALNTDIALAAGWTHEARGKERSKWWRAPGAQEYLRNDRPPKLSTSIDAITALIEREFGGDALSELMREALRAVGRKYRLHTEIWKPWWGTYTQALALELNAAFCRAMAAKSD